MGTYTKNLKLETPNYTDNADIPALTKKNNEIIDSEMIKRANGLDYNEQTGVLQLTGNNSKVGSPIQIKNNLPVTSMASGTELKVNNYKQLIKFTKEGKTEQKSYIGKNLLNYVDNLQSISGLTNTLNPDGSITTAGKPTADYTRIVKNYDITNLLEDKQVYTISQEKLNRKVFIQISAKKKDGTYTYYDSSAGKLSFTVDKSLYTNYSIVIQTPTMSVWGDESLTITNKYMLCKGTDTVDTSFEPYVGGQVSPSPNYPQKIKNVRGVENILPNSLAQGSWNTTNTLTRVANYSNVYLKAGTYVFSSDIDITKYKVWLGTSTKKLPHTDWNIINEIQSWIPLKKYTFTIKNDGYFLVMYRKADDSNITPSELSNLKQQLEEGPIAHDFVPYGSNYLQLKNTTDNESKTINIDLKGNELCSDKEQTLKDELMIENGRAKIIKKYDEVILDGTEDWVYDSTYKYFRCPTFNFGTQIPVFNANQLSNYFNITTSWVTFRDNINQNLMFSVQNASYKICIRDVSCTTAEQFKSKLKSLYDSGNPIKVQYELAEPKIIDLGEVDFELLENSTLTCEEEPNMQINYLTIDSNIFVQDSLDGNSSQKAPSVKAVNEAFDKISSYSSNEQIIGKWINGENLYRKVFEINMDSSSKEMTISTGISNMKQLTHAYGVGLYQNTIYIPLNFYNNLGWDSFHLTSKGANIILQRGDNFSITKVYITIEYTKNV